MDCPRVLACANREAYTGVRTVITDNPGLGISAAPRFSGLSINETGDNAWYGAVLLFCKLREFNVNVVGNCHSTIS
jgi:hypothetical protein